MIRPVGMVAGVEELLHVADHLLVHGPLQYLTEDGQDSNWSVVLSIKFASFPFVKWHHLGFFSFSWKLLVLDTEVQNMANRRHNMLPYKLKNVSIKIINP